MSGSQDVDLVAQAVRGDRESLDRLLVRHRDRLKRMVRVRMDTRLMARIDPSDVVQEALLVASQRFIEFSSQADIGFYPWLRRLTYERLVDAYHRHVTAQKRSVNREVRPAIISNDSAWGLAQQFALPGQDTPSQHLRQEETQQRVRVALESLEEDDREILILRHLEGHSIKEIAALLEIGEGAVKMRRLRAILKLRKQLEARTP